MKTIKEIIALLRSIEKSLKEIAACTRRGYSGGSYMHNNPNN